MVLDAVRGQGISERDIATAQFTLQPEYEDSYLTAVGYWARNTVAVTLRDLGKLELLLVDALAAGATSVDEVGFRSPTCASCATGHVRWRCRPQWILRRRRSTGIFLFRCS